MDLKGKKILVTGAGGFIGSHLTEKLIDLNAEVSAFVRYNSKNDVGFIKQFPQNKRENINIIFGDIRELETIRKAIKRIDIIFHLASLVGIPYSYIHPQEVVETNIIGTLNLLIASREKDIEKIILTSTSEVYGTARYVPIDENHLKQPQSPYSASKIAADALALSFYNAFNLPIAVCRPFNTYGPRQSARAIIPTIISQLLKKDEVMLGATLTTRDFTYVSDTVDGFIKIAQSEKSIGEEINLGTGTEISVNDLVKKITVIMGKSARLVIDEQRKRPEKSEVDRLCSNNAKARQLIGWGPQISLDEGLKKTITWMKDNLNMYEPNYYKV